MPLTAQQIVTKACSQANVPGFTAIAGDLLNAILQELAQDYDFRTAMKTFQFTMPTQVDSFNRNFMNFPTDYLRAIPDECWYYIMGVPYTLIPVDLSEFDMMVAQSGLSNFSVIFAVDVSLSPPMAFFWMPSNGNYPAFLRYQAQLPDIPTPASSSTVPWFPNQNYLLTRLTGELCKGYDDDRAASLLGDNPGGAEYIMRRYLQSKDDQADRAKTVKLDRRRFGGSFQNLRNTKLVGW